MTLPDKRGPLSEWVLDRLQGRGSLAVPEVPANGGLDDDLQLALYLCYESHYSTLPGISEDVEWDPVMIALRTSMERSFETSLRELVGPDTPEGHVQELLPLIIESDTGPSLSAHMESVGTLDEMREFIVHRSAYQLKEGDGHTFAIPRLDGRAKQLLVTIQAGEYGADAPDRTIHSALFAQTMRSLGLDDRRHAYLDRQPGTALAISNLISLFSLNRRWRGALVGHLAVFEMSSVVPMGRYGRGLNRMGAPGEARRFYDVHVLADAEHETMALDMAQTLADSEPNLAADIIFGARAVLQVERLFAERLLRGWGRLTTGRSRAAA